jgi:hypothetical protein
MGESLLSNIHSCRINLGGVMNILKNKILNVLGLLSYEKKLALFATFIFILFVESVFFVFGFVHVARYNICLLVIPQYLLCFMTLFYCIPLIISRKRAIIFCALIPPLCAVITKTISSIAANIMDEKLPFYIPDRVSGIFDIVTHYVFNFCGLATYFYMWGWFTSIPLLVICYFNFHLSKSAKCYSDKIVSAHPLKPIIERMRLFQHQKSTLVLIIAYIVCMAFYLYVLKWQWNDSGIARFRSSIPVCLLSFLSLIYLAPTVIDRAIKFVACCIVLPLLWSAMIYVVYAALILSFSILSSTDLSTYPYSIKIGETFFSLDGIFSIKFYLTSYIDTQAWFISLSLLLICCIYYYLAKIELARIVPLMPNKQSR